MSQREKTDGINNYGEVVKPAAKPYGVYILQ